MAALPVLNTKTDVANALGLKVSALNYLLYALPPEWRYTTFELRKRAGGVRTIKAPIRRIKEAQRIIMSWLDAAYVPRPCVFGYVGGRNIQLNADQHLRKRWVLRVDLKDFFPSINFGRVRGMFMASPFSLNKRVATLLAQICCDGSALPQGAPSSPTISNIIARGLDASLVRLANKNQCHYTRYCDDLIFSSTRRHFPAAVASIEPNGTVALGSALLDAIVGAGFVVNHEKLSLRNSGQRHMVTGLITNHRRNVPREYVRNLRVVLHKWETDGEQNTSAWFFTNHYNKNRPPKKPTPLFAKIVRGRVQYVGSVRGFADKIYLQLARRLASLDNTFVITASTATAGVTPSVAPRAPLQIYVEGKSDKAHIENALRLLQGTGLVPQLRLRLMTKGRGAGDMKQLCKSLSQHEQTPPVVFLFDSDEQNTVKEVTSSNGDTKDWGNNVYSLVLPTPVHRQTLHGVCIELLYADGDIARRDTDGRRLYLAYEFSKLNGRHTSEPVYCTSLHQRTLVVEHVFEVQPPSKSIGLSKMDFAALIESRGSAIDLSGFVLLLQKLDGLSAQILP